MYYVFYRGTHRFLNLLIVSHPISGAIFLMTCSDSIQNGKSFLRSMINQTVARCLNAQIKIWS